MLDDHQYRYGAIAKRLCSGLQSRLGRFDSGSRLQDSKEKALTCQGFFFVRGMRKSCRAPSIVVKIRLSFT
jgi:hypothetical protein